MNDAALGSLDGVEGEPRGCGMNVKRERADTMQMLGYELFRAGFKSNECGIWRGAGHEVETKTNGKRLAAIQPLRKCYEVSTIAAVNVCPESRETERYVSQGA